MPPNDEDQRAAETEQPEVVVDEYEQELDEKREELAGLRAEIAEAEEEKARKIREVSHEAEVQLLDAEAERLKRQLAAIRDEPAPVKKPSIGTGDTEVVDPKAAPAPTQTPVSGSLATARETMKNSADASAAKPEKE